MILAALYLTIASKHLVGTSRGVFAWLSLNSFVCLCFYFLQSSSAASIIHRYCPITRLITKFFLELTPPVEMAPADFLPYFIALCNHIDSDEGIIQLIATVILFLYI